MVRNTTRPARSTELETHLETLIEEGLTPAEAVDYIAVVESDIADSGVEWAEKRGFTPSAINQNVKQAENKLTHAIDADIVAAASKNVDEHDVHDALARIEEEYVTDDALNVFDEHSVPYSDAKENAEEEFGSGTEPNPQSEYIKFEDYDRVAFAGVSNYVWDEILNEVGLDDVDASLTDAIIQSHDNQARRIAGYDVTFDSFAVVTQVE